jgi:Na+/melibiose symporter and related transporters
MRMESTPTHMARTQYFAIGGALLSIPVQLTLSRKLGRANTLTLFLSLLGLVFVGATFIPFADFRPLLFAVGVCLGVCLTLPNVIPDAILGDIIDYDELLNGTRSEAMYTMVETNIQQVGAQALSPSARRQCGLRLSP